MRKLLAVFAFSLVVCCAAVAWAETLTSQEKDMPIVERTQIRLLIEDLGNYKDAQVKAMDKLVAIGNPAVPILLRYIDKSGETVKGNICMVLGRIGALDAIPAIGGLFGDSSIYVRYMAKEGLRTLAHANGGACIGDVISFLRDRLKDPDENVRSLSVEVLVDLNPVDFWEDLLPLLGDSNWKVRADAVKALGGISTLTNPEQHTTICNALAPLFSDSSWEVKRSVAIAAGFYIARSTMYVMVNEDEQGNFTGLKPSENLPVLANLVEKTVTLLKDESAPVRASAAYALSHFWAEKAKDMAENVMSSLIAALDDADPEVRMASATALGRVGDKNAVGALVAHLEEKVPLVLTVIIEALRNRTLLDFGFPLYDILDETTENPIDTIEKYREAMKEIEAKREEAINKWKAWWEDNKDNFEVNQTIR